VALRVVARLGYAMANPVTLTGETAGRSPCSALGMGTGKREGEADGTRQQGGVAY
jgi:hypothetical protein